jgi:hypothetical protein
VCRADLAQYLPRFEALVQAAGHLRAVRLERDRDNGIRLIDGRGRGVDLHPLLIWRAEDEHFYFYNDIKKPKASFLNYEDALKWRSKEHLDELLSRYRIEEWSRVPAEQFRERIEELTETFKGRRDELGQLQSFLQRPRGFLMVWGSPGVGKSALLAEAVRLWGKKGTFCFSEAGDQGPSMPDAKKQNVPFWPPNIEVAARQAVGVLAGEAAHVRVVPARADELPAGEAVVLTPLQAERRVAPRRLEQGSNW